jgi:ABC-2 type transport system ATP-binding protein
MRIKTVLLALCAASVWLTGCDSSDSSGSRAAPETPQVPEVPGTESRAGEVYRQEIESPIGDTVVFQVMEPTQIEAGKTYPLVLQGHGYGGQRNVEPTAFQQRLRDAGYYVISIDQRGFGESTGTVRVMDPEYEGVNLVAILDWAENLPGLARRPNGEMLVGSYGGSYGGMYQVLLWAVDPRHRLRVLAPDITPHDLTYALAPHGVVKSGWGLLLAVGGEATNAQNFVMGALGFDTAAIMNPPPHQDPAIFETLVQAILTSRFSQSSLNFFKYHSFAYYCEGQPAGPQDFIFATPDQLTQPAVLPPAADVLITQGVRDTLFNYNDGYKNYQCIKSLGGDVRFLTHQSGHLLPSAIPAQAQAAADAFYAAITLPNTQEAGGSRSCGDINLDNLTFAWFEEKLAGKAGAVDAVLGGSARNICHSLAEGEAIEVADTALKVGGGTPIALDGSVPQFSAVLGTATSILGTQAREALLADQPLLTVPAGGMVLAGIPKLSLDLQPLGGAGLESCPLPVLNTACDPALFLALGRRPAGQTRWELIDDQITPIRGFGTREIEMNGVSVRLAEGEEVALLIYGFHAQFPLTWSRDVFVPAASISGSIELPVLSAGEILKTRIKVD